MAETQKLEDGSEITTLLHGADPITGAVPPSQIITPAEMDTESVDSTLLHTPGTNLNADQGLSLGRNEGRVEVTHAGQTVRMVKGQMQARDKQTGRWVALGSGGGADGGGADAGDADFDPDYKPDPAAAAEKIEGGEFVQPEEPPITAPDERQAAPEAEEEPEAEEPEAEAQEAEEEEAPAKKTKQRTRRKNERYDALHAENAALRAERDALLASRQPAQEPGAIDYSQMPKPDGTDTDEQYQAKVEAWMKTQIGARDLALQAARERAEQQASNAADNVRTKHVSKTYEEELKTRFTADERAVMGPKAAAVRGKFATDPKTPRPVTTYFLRERSALEAAGHLSEDAKPATEVFGDLYADPGSLQTIEDLTTHAPIMQALAMLDDPVPAAVYLGSAEGKQDFEYLDRMAKERPNMVFHRVARVAAKVSGLNGRPQGGREPAPETRSRASKTPPPGHSPKGGRGAPAPAKQKPEPRQRGMVDPEYLKRVRQSTWTTTQGRN